MQHGRLVTSPSLQSSRTNIVALARLKAGAIELASLGERSNIDNHRFAVNGRGDYEHPRLASFWKHSKQAKPALPLFLEAPVVRVSDAEWYATTIVI